MAEERRSPNNATHRSGEYGYNRVQEIESSTELIYHRHYATRDEATQDIFEYIEVFYNRQRRHSPLGYDSPAEYEARAAVA